MTATTAPKPVLRDSPSDPVFTFIVDPNKSPAELFEAAAFNRAICSAEDLGRLTPEPGLSGVKQVCAKKVLPGVVTSELATSVLNKIDPVTFLHLAAKFKNEEGTMFTVWQDNNGDYWCLSVTSRYGRREFVLMPSMPTARWEDSDRLLVFA